MERFKIGIGRPAGLGNKSARDRRRDGSPRRRRRRVRDRHDRRSRDAYGRAELGGEFRPISGSRPMSAGPTNTAGGRRSGALPVARFLHATGLAARPTTRGLPALHQSDRFGPDGSPRGSKGNTGGAATLQAVAAPATVSGETTPRRITGKPGRSAFVLDPRARRPAIARTIAMHSSGSRSRSRAR